MIVKSRLVLKRVHCCPSASVTVRLSANTFRQVGRKGRRRRQDKHRALRWAEKGTNRRRAAQRRQSRLASLAKNWEYPNRNHSAWQETSICVHSAWSSSFIGLTYSAVGAVAKFARPADTYKLFIRAWNCKFIHSPGLFF